MCSKRSDRFSTWFYRWKRPQIRCQGMAQVVLVPRLSHSSGVMGKGCGQGLEKEPTLSTLVETKRRDCHKLRRRGERPWSTWSGGQESSVPARALSRTAVLQGHWWRCPSFNGWFSVLKDRHPFQCQLQVADSQRPTNPKPSDLLRSLLPFSDCCTHHFASVNNDRESCSSHFLSWKHIYFL